MSISRWCHPTISSSVIPVSSCLQSFPASGSFQMSQYFTSGGQSIGVFSLSISPSDEYSGLISFRMYLKESPSYSLCMCRAGDEGGEIELWGLRAEVERLQDTGQGTVKNSFFLHILKEVLHPPLSLLSPPESRELFFFFPIVFIFGSLLLCRLLLWLLRVGLLSGCGAQASHCGGFSCSRAQALGHVGSVVVAHRSSCSVAIGIFLNQGSNPCPLHWQGDSYLLWQRLNA